MKIKKLTGFTLVELIIVLGILALFFSTIATIWKSLEDRKERKFQQQLQLQHLPGADTSALPVPMIIVNHLGGDWVIARGEKTRWKTVIYYPTNIITYKSSEPVNDSHDPNSLSGKTNIIVLRVYALRTKHEDDTIGSENFLLPPLPNDDVLFTGVEPALIEFLKSKAQQTHDSSSGKLKAKMDQK